jgi:Holliday junction resolvase RusA-like endonuclease
MKRKQLSRNVITWNRHWPLERLLTEKLEPRERSGWRPSVCTGCVSGCGGFSKTRMLTMGLTINFFVAGKPATSGSKHAMISKSTGKLVVLADNKRQRSWQQMVASEAREAYDGLLLTGPVRLEVQLVFLRPKSHFKGNGEDLRKGAPERPISRPDSSKCVRAIEDALTGVVWRDDSQVVEHEIAKTYGSPAGAWVKVEEL